jgi:hypothetical protein
MLPAASWGDVTAVPPVQGTSGRADYCRNIIRVEMMCWLGNRSGTMATGKQLILSRRAAKTAKEAHAT